MKIHFLPLYADVRLSGVNLEKVMNCARKNHIILRSVRRLPDRNIVCRCQKEEASRLLSLCERFSCRMEFLPAAGFFKIFEFIKTHSLLLFLFFIGLLAIHISLHFVWQIRLTDAGPYAGDIRSYLQSKNIHAGCLKKDISLSSLREELEWRFPQTAWIRTEYKGVCLCITVVHGTPSPSQENLGPVGHILASEDGIVESILTLAGTPRVKAGDFVRRGQILIEGLEKNGADTFIPVKARGQITARTWVERRFFIPAKKTLSQPTGKAEDFSVICTPFLSFSFHLVPSYETADYSLSYTPLIGAWFPVFVRQDHYEEVKLSSQFLSDDEINTEISLASEKILSSYALDGDVPIDKWAVYSMIEEEKFAVRAGMEVLRDIGRFETASPSFSPLSPSL